MGLVHTHPRVLSPVEFSLADDKAEYLLFEAAHKLAGIQYLLSVVVGKSSVAARVWTSPHSPNWERINRLILIDGEIREECSLFCRESGVATGLEG